MEITYVEKKKYSRTFYGAYSYNCHIRSFEY